MKTTWNLVEENLRRRLFDVIIGKTGNFSRIWLLQVSRLNWWTTQLSLTIRLCSTETTLDELCLLTVVVSAALGDLLGVVQDYSERWLFQQLKCSHFVECNWKKNKIVSPFVVISAHRFPFGTERVSPSNQAVLQWALWSSCSHPGEECCLHSLTVSFLAIRTFGDVCNFETENSRLFRLLDHAFRIKCVIYRRNLKTYCETNDKEVVAGMAGEEPSLREDPFATNIESNWASRWVEEAGVGSRTRRHPLEG